MFKLALEKQDDGSWAAYDDNRYDGDAESLDIGRGATEDEACEDLAEAMEFNDEGGKLIRDVIAMQRRAQATETRTPDLATAACRVFHRLPLTMTWDERIAVAKDSERFFAEANARGTPAARAEKEA